VGSSVARLGPAVDERVETSGADGEARPMKGATYLAAVAAGLWLASAAAAAPASAGLQSELLRLEQERQAAYVSGDRAVLERQFATEYEHTNLNGGQTNRAQELAFYAPGAFSLQDGRIEAVEVRDYGDVAVLIGLVHWRGAAYRPNPTTSIDLSGDFRVTRVYVKRDGRWQLTASHASRIPPVAAPTNGDQSAPG
jgi:hypothetical protein